MSQRSRKYLSTGFAASVALLSACQAQQPAKNLTKDEAPDVRNNMATTPSSSAVSKQEVIEFLQKFKIAVETDAFADPNKLKEVLGLETSQWLVDGTNDKLTGAYGRPQNWKFKEAWLNRESKGTFTHFNSGAYTLRHFDRFLRYDVGILNIDQANSLSVSDIRSIFGMALVKQVPWIGSHPLSGGAAKGGWHVTLEYDYPTDVDKKTLRFEFNHDATGNPLDLKNKYF